MWWGSIPVVMMGVQAVRHAPWWVKAQLPPSDDWIWTQSDGLWYGLVTSRCGPVTSWRCCVIDKAAFLDCDVIIMAYMSWHLHLMTWLQVLHHYFTAVTSWRHHLLLLHHDVINYCCYAMTSLLTAVTSWRGPVTSSLTTAVSMSPFTWCWWRRERGARLPSRPTGCS